MSGVWRFLKGAIGHNLGLKLLALGLSATLWWFVGGENQLVQVGRAIPVEIRNVPPGTVITNKVERQVEVQLSGPPAMMGSLKGDELSALVDLAGSRPGKRIISLEARSIRVPPGVKVNRISPSALEIILERLERRTMTVLPRISYPSVGKRRIRKIEVVPESVEVEAPASEAGRPQTLYTEEIPVPPGKAVVTAEARVELWSVHARIVGNPVVKVRIHFK